MISILLLHIKQFRKKGEDDFSILLESLTFDEISDKTKQFNSSGEPGFSTSCDLRQTRLSEFLIRKLFTVIIF